MVIYNSDSNKTVVKLFNAIQRGKFMYDEDFALKYITDIVEYLDHRISLIGNPVSRNKIARYKNYKIRYVRYKRKSSKTIWYAYYISKKDDHLIIKIANNHTDYSKIKG